MKVDGRQEVFDIPEAPKILFLFFFENSLQILIQANRDLHSSM
jgi:hypothetical protein